MSWNEVYELVKLAQTGDRTAYGELVKRFEPAVYAVALARLRNPTDAQELTQEVFIHVMTKLGQLRDPQCFAGWLRQITVRMAINRITRGGHVQGTDQEILQNTAATGDSPLETLVRDEQASQLWKSLRRLKQVDRETLVAFYIRGHSLARMARDFETPVGTIKRRLHVARNRLREVLEEDRRGDGDEPTPRKKPKKGRGPKNEEALACV